MDTKALRQKVLDLAIRGKLVPQDPNDEPASVLLERIRAEKQRMVKEGKLKAKDIKDDTIIFVGDDNLHYEKFADGSVKCIEDEIPFALPEGWTWTRIRSVAPELPYGTAQKSSVTGAVAVLRMGNIQNGEIDYSDLVYSSDEADIQKYSLHTDDLLFNRTNSAEWVGKTAIYRGNMPAIYAGYLIRLRTPLCADFLNAVMNSAYAKDYCNRVKTDGVNQSNINAQKLGAFIIPVPPILEQQRIAKFICDVLPLIGAIQNEKETITVLVKKAKAKILDLAIRGQLLPQDPDDEPASNLLERIRAEKEVLIKQGKIKRDKKESIIFRGDDNSYYEKIGSHIENIDAEIPFEIPESWEWCRIKDICTMAAGKSKSTDEIRSEPILNCFPCFGGNGIRGYVNEYSHDGQYSIIGRQGALCGNVKIAEGRFYATEHAVVTTVFSGIDFAWSNYTLTALHLNQYATGAAQPGLSVENIMNVYIPLPPYREQHAIGKRTTQLLTILNDIEESLS